MRAYGRGEQATCWRGGEVVHHGRTWVYDPDHPNANKTNPYVYQYRRVMAAVLGRPLGRGETVHHLNGDTSDDRPENLAVVSRSEHAKLHGLGKTGHRRPHKTVCANGHRKTPENVYVSRDGRWACKTCRRAQALAYYRRKADQ